jgi:hypothetical protein
VYNANVQKTLFQALNKTLQVYTIKIPELKKVCSENVDMSTLSSVGYYLIQHKFDCSLNGTSLDKTIGCFLYLLMILSKESNISYC